MRYLITGAQGFAGRFLCAEILRADRRATIVGCGRSPSATTFTHEVSRHGRRVRAPLTADLRAPDSNRYEYVACELRGGAALDRLVERSAPDVVIHLAAALRDDPAAALITANVGGTEALADALVKSGRRPRLILGSSGSVYGPPLALPVTEEQRCAPREPYALSKLAAEFVARVLTAEAGIPTIVARIFNIAGPGQDERHVCGRFAAQAAAIVGGAAPVIETGDLRPTRDFIDVRDVARALIVLAEHGVPGEIYNVASGVETSIGDVLAHTLHAAGLSERVEIVEKYARAGDVSRAYAGIGKLLGCGYTPALSLQRSIADLFDYYLNEVADVSTRETTSATSASVTATPSNQG